MYVLLFQEHISVHHKHRNSLIQKHLSNVQVDNPHKTADHDSFDMSLVNMIYMKHFEEKECMYQVHKQGTEIVHLRCYYHYYRHW